MYKAEYLSTLLVDLVSRGYSVIEQTQCVPEGFLLRTEAIKDGRSIAIRKVLTKAQVSQADINLIAYVRSAMLGEVHFAAGDPDAWQIPGIEVDVSI